MVYCIRDKCDGLVVFEFHKDQKPRKGICPNCGAEYRMEMTNPKPGGKAA